MKKFVALIAVLVLSLSCVALAEGNADVRVRGLPRPVDGAAHHRYGKRDADIT